MVREIDVGELFERQSLEYLAEVLREVRALCLSEDPFFDRARSLLPVRHVQERNGRFNFRFDPSHRGRPWAGRTYAFCPNRSQLMRVADGLDPVSVRSPVTPEALLAAFRELLVAEVMSL